MNPTESLVAVTFDALFAALTTTVLPGTPVERCKSTDRAIEALAGYALGVFANHVATRLQMGADLVRSNAIRLALYREIAKVTSTPIDTDILFDDKRTVNAHALRARVGQRLRASRADCTRIVAAMATASGADERYVQRVFADLGRSDLVAMRFADRVETVWTELHTTTFEPPPVAKPAYCVVEIR